MGRRFIPLTVLALILCLAGDVTIVNADTTRTGADPGDNAMDIAGGSSTIAGDWSIGKKGSAIVNISGGTVDIGDDLNIGPKGGEITFNMTGGVVVYAAGSLIVARKGGAVATFNMYGGTIYSRAYCLSRRECNRHRFQCTAGSRSGKHRERFGSGCQWPALGITD
ncbi:MAG: hypothetical protein ISS70_23095 [Phycisphaerae bacterium]|nr:hypothetical protein [Phycisphaerae bacterium]